MNIRIQREFRTDAEADTIRERLGKWSDKYTFICTRDQHADWEFQRGSHLMAAFTFDVRKIPTTVTINVSDGTPEHVECIMHVKSSWNIATPGDPKRVEEQIELLIAYLKGAFDPQ